MASLRGLPGGLLAGILLAACSHPAAGPAQDALVIVQTQPIALAIPGSDNGAVSEETAALLHRSLVAIDAKGRLVPDAARQVPTRENGGISADGLTISYRLKPDLHFSDGSPLRAADVVATLDALRSPDARITSRLGLDDVRAVDAPDPLDVRVRLARPYAPILLDLCGPGNATSILPAPTAYAIETSAAPPQTIGAGPYRVKSFLAGDRLELEANPWYSPAPLTKTIVIRTVGSSETAHVQLHSGEASGYVMADPALESMLADVPGIRTDAVPVDGIGGLIFNTRASPVESPLTRLAIVDALDIAASVRRVFHGGVSAHDAPAGLFLWAYDPRAFPPPVYSPKERARYSTLRAGALAPMGNATATVRRSKSRSSSAAISRAAPHSQRPSPSNCAVSASRSRRVNMRSKNGALPTGRSIADTSISPSRSSSRARIRIPPISLPATASPRAATTNRATAIRNSTTS